ncbi:hypothetical protein SprV_0200920900 [Sparganum proliferum]
MDPAVDACLVQPILLGEETSVLFVVAVKTALMLTDFATEYVQAVDWIASRSWHQGSSAGVFILSFLILQSLSQLTAEIEAVNRKIQQDGISFICRNLIVELRSGGRSSHNAQDFPSQQCVLPISLPDEGVVQELPELRPQCI